MHLQVLESVLARRLFPLSVFVTDLRHHDPAKPRAEGDDEISYDEFSDPSTWEGPYVVYEVSSGTVLVDGAIFRRLGRSAVEVRWLVFNMLSWLLI